MLKRFGVEPRVVAPLLGAFAGVLLFACGDEADAVKCPVGYTCSEVPVGDGADSDGSSAGDGGVGGGQDNGGEPGLGDQAGDGAEAVGDGADTLDGADSNVDGAADGPDGADGADGAEADGADGADGEPPPPATSTGCGKADFPESGTYTIDVDGTERTYIVSLPDGYDPNEPYRVIFAWHYLGGTAEGIASGGFGGNSAYYGLKSRSANSTIFVAGQGLGGAGGTGWPNTGGRDVAFAKAMYESLRASYCIDEARVFATGMSYGGIMSNTVGCAMGDVFRAIAPIAGSGPGFGNFGGPACTGQVAAWIAHGNTDGIVSFASGERSRDHWVESNHCDTGSVATEPSPCVAYSGCDDGHPVHWCEFDGGHTIPSFAADAIWSFFSQF